MSKRTQKDSGEERLTAKSKPMMNLVSRCSERTPDVLASTASESSVKTRHESQSSLSSQTEQHHRTRRAVVDAYSSSYSEWNADKNWFSQEWKSDEVMEVRTGRLCLWTTTRFVRRAHGQIYCWWQWWWLWHRRRIRHVFKIQIILAHCEWSSAKDAGPIVRRCNTRQQQTFFIMENVYVFDIGSICIRGKELPGKFTFHQKYRRSHCKTEVWPIWKVDSRTEVYGVNTINWEDASWKILSLIGDEEVISLSHAKVYVFSESVLCFGKMSENPQSNTVLEDKLTWFKSSEQYRAFGHNWWWANGTRVEYCPRIHHIAALQQSPRAHV